MAVSMLSRPPMGMCIVLQCNGKGNLETWVLGNFFQKPSQERREVERKDGREIARPGWRTVYYFPGCFLGLWKAQPCLVGIGEEQKEGMYFPERDRKLWNPGLWESGRCKKENAVSQWQCLVLQF